MNVEDLASDPQATEEDYRRFLQTSERALSRLEYLVEELLLLARGEKEIEQTRIVLGVQLEEILEELASIAEEHQVFLKMSGDLGATIIGDPALLDRALSNLIENGIYYNRPDGFVDISIREEKDQVIIEIRDSGAGLSAHQKAHLFERFYRAPGSLFSNRGGNGLGLAITAHIIKLREGQISVESVLGQGSTFQIVLRSYTS